MIVARSISALFMPLYLPMVGMALLFILTPLNMLSLRYKLMVLIGVYVLTVLMPRWLIHAYLHYTGIHPIHLLQRERRAAPYAITLACYLLCYYVMTALHIPHIITGVAMAALGVECVCAAINVWTKISTHTAGIGGMTGALQAFAAIFGFNPVWWICVTLLLAGIVGSSRMILRLHTLGQVVGGYVVGLITAFAVVIFT